MPKQYQPISASLSSLILSTPTRIITFQAVITRSDFVAKVRVALASRAITLPLL